VHIYLLLRDDVEVFANRIARRMLQKRAKVALEMWSSQDLPILEEPC